MIIHNGEKYACLNCIRGHRSSACSHMDRPLLQVRKRGRPVPDDTERIALLPSRATTEETELSSDTKQSLSPRSHTEAKINGAGDLNRLLQPAITKRTLRFSRRNQTQKSCCGSESPSPTPKSECPDEASQVIFTAEWAFVPEGNGLYRKYPREATPSPDGDHAKLLPEESVRPAQSTQGGLEPISELVYGHQNSVYGAPGIIAPMDYDGKSVLALGLTEDEASSLWTDNQNIEYTASCAMPDQCHCGDSCACAFCYTHGSARHSL